MQKIRSGLIILVLIIALVAGFPSSIEKAQAAAASVYTVPAGSPIEGVEHPGQTKTFIAKGRDWAFFPGGDPSLYLVWRTSTDEGATWGSSTNTGLGVVQYWSHEFCLYYDDVLDYVHLVASGEEETSTYYRRGRPNSDGSITWSAAWQTVLTGASSTKWPSITVDASGYPWVSYSKFTGITDLQPYVIKSSKNDGTWTTAGGFPYQLKATDSASWKTDIVALSTGDVYVAYGCNGSHPIGYIFGKLYTSGVGWGSEEYVDGGYGGAKYSQDFSLIAAGDDSLHVLYMKRYVPPGEDYVNIRHGWRGLGVPNYWADQEDAVTDIPPTGSIRAALSYSDTLNDLVGFYWDYSGQQINYTSLDLDAGYTGTWTSPQTLDTGENLGAGTRICVSRTDWDNRIGVLWYVSGSRLVRYDYLDTLPLGITGLSIPNWEGCGNWLFAQQRWYEIFTSWTIMPGTEADILNLEVRFGDGFNNITLGYDRTYQEFILWEGEDVATTKNGIYAYAGGTSINVTFYIWLQQDIIDAYDVDVYVHGNTSSFDTGWILQEPDYFHIYSVGGKQEFTFTGTGGVRSGGDAWDLYAGGFFKEADIFSEEFPGPIQTSAWTLQTFTDESADNKIEVVDYPYYTQYFSCYLQDGIQGSPYPNMVHTESPGISENFTVSLFVRMDDNTTGYGIIFLWGNTTLSQSAELGAVRFGTAADYDTVYVDTNSSVTATAFSFNADTWYNVTIRMNWDYDTYSVWIDGVCYASNWPTMQNEGPESWTWTQLKLEVDWQFSATKTVFRVDDISVFRVDAGGYSGTAISTAAFRKMQWIRVKQSLAIPQGETAITDPGEGYVEYGVDYCQPNGTWVNNAWNCRIQVQSGTVNSAENFVQLLVTWYVRGVEEKTDSIYVFWEGWEGGNDWITYTVDLWFNQINGSRVVGGKVTSHFYAMQDRSIPWLRWWSGTEWSPMYMDSVSVDFFHPLEDADGNVISSQALDLMRFREKVWRSTNHLYQWLCRNTEMTPQLVSYTGKMMGVSTPETPETVTPEINTLGVRGLLVGGFIAGMSKLGQDLARASWSLFTFFIGALDTLAAWLGHPNFFSEVLSFMGTLFSTFTNAIVWFGSWLVSMLTFGTVSIGYFLGFLATGLTIWATMFTGFFTLVNGMGGTAFDVWTGLGIPTWIYVGFLFYPMYLIILWDEKGGQAVIDQLTFIFNLISMVGHAFLTVIQVVIDMASRVIEAIPVVE